MADSYKVFDKSPIVDDALSIHGYSFKKRELALGGVALVALIVCVILAALLASAKSGSSGPLPTSSGQVQCPNPCQGPNNTCKLTDYPFCLTPTCMKSSAYVIENMNTNVDPCDNFYQHACGTWSQNNPLKPDVSQLTPAWNLHYKNRDRLRKLLETPTSSKTGTAETKLKDFFASCSDHYGKMNAGGNPFLQQVVSKSGGWYGIGTFNETTFDLNDMVKMAHVDFWTNVFFTYSVRTDWLDWNKDTIQVDLSGTGISWYYYVQSFGQLFVNNYKTFIRTVVGFLLRDSGVQLTDAERKTRIDTVVSDVIAVETGLAVAVNNSEGSKDPHKTENRMKLQELNTLTNNTFDFVGFFKYMFDEVNVGADTSTVVLEKDYLKRMAQFIDGLGTNRARMLNNYITWRMAHKYVQDLSWDYIHANRAFYVSVTQRAEFLGTYRYCLGIVDRDMGDALSSLYVRDHFSQADKNKAHDIIDYLKNAFIEQIGDVKWMDQQTKLTAQQKIHQSLFKMGYPAFMKDETVLNSMYESLEIDKSDYIKNRMNMNKFYRKDWNRRLKNGKDKDEWAYKVYDVLVEYYNPWKELTVPAGLLQWPIYDHKLPHFMNFGSLGVTIAHHLIHAIDQTGSQYKLDGSHLGVWWTNATRSGYENVRKCVINAYSGLTTGPFNLSTGDQRTLKVDAAGYSPEALAETSGIRLAYRAFKTWEKRNTVEKPAPGMTYTNDQMFFLSYAQANCFNRAGNEAFLQANRGVLQENLKVRMALSQVPEFRKAFNCPAKSKMVAKQLCNMY